MRRYFVVSLIAILLWCGCATDSGPKPDFQTGTRVGIFNGLESHLTHRHITIRRFNSFERQIDVDWNIPDYVSRRLGEALKEDPRFTVIRFKSQQIQSQMEQLAGPIGAAANRRRISQDLAAFIENQARAHDLDVIIVVQSFKGESPWKMHNNVIELQGYGLFTRRTVLGTVGVRNSWAHPYAQIRVVVFTTRPAAKIATGLPRLTKGRMNNFNWPSDIKNIPQSELDKLRPRIQAYADQAVANALQDANMRSF